MRGKLTPRRLAVLFGAIAVLTTVNLLLCFWDVGERQFRRELNIPTIVGCAIGLMCSLFCMVVLLGRSRQNGGRADGEGR